MQHSWYLRCALTSIIIMGSRRSTSMEKSQGRWGWWKSTPARRTWIRMIQDDDHFTILLAIGLAKYLLRDRPMGLEDDNWEFEDQLKDWSTEKLQTDLKKTMDEVEKTHNSMVATANEKRKTKKQLYGDAGRKVAKRLFSENDYRNVQYDRYTAQDNRRVYVIIDHVDVLYLACRVVVVLERAARHWSCSTHVYRGHIWYGHPEYGPFIVMRMSSLCSFGSSK